MVDLVGRPAVQSRVRSRLVVPIDDALDLAFELRLVLWHYDQTQEFFHCAMETFNNRNTTVPPYGSKSRQDVLGIAPNSFKVLAFEFGPLVNNQVLGTHSFGNHNAIQGGRYFLRGRSALEHRESHGSSGEMIDHIEHPPAHGPSFPDGVGNPVGPEAAGNRYRREIGMPGMAGVLRDELALLGPVVGRRIRPLDRLLLQDPPDGRLADVNACSGQRVGDLGLAQRRAEQLDVLNGIADEVRKSVHRRLRLDQ